VRPMLPFRKCGAFSRPNPSHLGINHKFTAAHSKKSHTRSFVFFSILLPTTAVMSSGENHVASCAVAEKSPDNTVAEHGNKYMFPPAEVGIPLTKLQWCLTFVGYGNCIKSWYWERSFRKLSD